MNKLEKIATDYLNQNKQQFLNEYTKEIQATDEKNSYIYSWYEWCWEN